MLHQDNVAVGISTSGAHAIPIAGSQNELVGATLTFIDIFLNRFWIIEVSSSRLQAVLQDIGFTAAFRGQRIPDGSNMRGIIGLANEQVELRYHRNTPSLRFRQCWFPLGIRISQ